MKITPTHISSAKRKSGTNLPPNLIRHHIVKLRLNDYENEYLNAMRSVLKLSRAEYTRLAILENIPMHNPQINIVAWTELSKVASNLNQLVRKTSNAVHADIEECKNILKQLRAKLLGAFGALNG